MPSCGARHCARLERGALVDRGEINTLVSSVLNKNSREGYISLLFGLICFKFA